MNETLVFSHAIALQICKGSEHYDGECDFAIFNHSLSFLRWVEERAKAFKEMRKRDPDLVYWEYWDTSIYVLKSGEKTEGVDEEVANSVGNPVYVPSLVVPDWYAQRTEIEMLKLDDGGIHWHFREKHVDIQMETAQISHSDLRDLLSPVQQLIELSKEKDREEAGEDAPRGGRFRYPH